MEIELAGEKLVLSADKIIYWPKRQTIFIADLHLGKATHFRKSGIAVPMTIIKTEINRLENIISKFRPKRVFFLGDLFHSDLNHEWNIFSAFLEQHSELEFTLVKGNHDILQADVYKSSSLKIQDEPLNLQPFILSHHPIEKEQIKVDQVNLCGHLHPGIRIKGKAKSYLNLACFYQEERKMILPAFGSFTGLAKIKTKKESSSYAVLNDSVKKIS